ncbi:MAG: hypothetical protein D3922_08220, partial [Candidatus Electrothrix sp. AR1]|nr:hypothetical protein [Candidatus Electrothrix sp. AR1]
MKKQIVILFCLAFLSLAHASHSMVPDKSHRINFTELGRELAAQPTRILKKDKTKAVLQSGIPHCDVRSKKLKDGHIYQRIAMPGLERIGEVGLPERPFREELVRITSGAEVKLVIDQIDWHDIHEQIQLAPVQPPLPDVRIPDGERPDMAIPFEKDVAAYTVDEFTSQNPVSLGDRVRIRGKEYITVIYDPISYNSKKKKVRIAYNVSWHLNIQEPPSSTDAVQPDLLKKT